MRFHPKHSQILFSFFMSCFMAFLMSGVVTALNQGVGAGFVGQWMSAYIRVWPIAFVLLFVLRPLVSKIVAALTLPPNV